MSIITLPAQTLMCFECGGAIAKDGQEAHEHEPSCSYWGLRCFICRIGLSGTGGAAFHPAHPELCFWCGDRLEVDSHP